MIRTAAYDEAVGTAATEVATGGSKTRARRCTAYREIAGGPCRLGVWLIRPVRCVISGLRPKTFR
jgi:hypothetical protein